MMTVFDVKKKKKKKVCDEMKWRDDGIYNTRKTLHARPPYVMGLDFACPCTRDSRGI